MLYFVSAKGSKGSTDGHLPVLSRHRDCKPEEHRNIQYMGEP